MGLDATVYRRLANLPAYLRERVTVDPESGEVYLRDTAECGLFDLSKTKAWHEYLGNVALIAFIRNEIAEAFGSQDSLLSKKVVYSGSHGGDHIPFSQINLLSNEIDELEEITSTSRSPELANFIAQMRNLIAAANREWNGIVF